MKNQTTSKYPLKDCTCGKMNPRIEIAYLNTLNPTIRTENMLEKLDYKNNSFDIRIQGNFRDSNDSMYFISQEQSWHITFVKVGDKLEEWIREVVVIEGMNYIFKSEVEFKYSSPYKSMSGAKAFLKKQKDFEEYKSFIYDFLIKLEVTEHSFFDSDSTFGKDSLF